MSGYIVRRVWQMIPTMLGVVLLVFILFNLFGGDPAYVLAGKISNPEQIDNIRRQLGVDQPYYVQLGIFVKQILTGDFGASWSTNERVSHILATRLGPSMTVLVPLLILDTIITARSVSEPRTYATASASAIEISVPMMSNGTSTVSEGPRRVPMMCETRSLVLQLAPKSPVRICLTKIPSCT